MKVVLLLWYSNKNFCFRKIRSHLVKKNWLWNLKMPYFWWLVIKLSYKIQTNPFRMFICDQKTIKFRLTPYKIPQRWSYQLTVQFSFHLFLNCRQWTISSFGNLEESRPLWCHVAVVVQVEFQFHPNPSLQISIRHHFVQKVLLFPLLPYSPLHAQWLRTEVV